MPLSAVKPGMVGEALTVFQGSKPEPFKVRVVSVLRNFLPKQDVILIRAEDPRVEHSGIVAGMSGSPVYIDGKLVGAVAYAWSFAKEPLGGVTPIETMLAERARPRRSGKEVLAEGWPAPNIAPAGKGGRFVDSGGDIPHASLSPRSAASDGPAALARGLGLPPTAPTMATGEPRLLRASVPLSVSGFTARTVAELSESFAPTGLVPLQAGGGRKPGPPAAGHVAPGSAIGVELVRGDMSTVATGTVTYVDGRSVLAFGHPLFGIGEVYLPMVDAQIHAFMPSLAQSFKMSSPLNEVGTLVQDRQSCIIGDLDARSTMLPIDVRVSGPGVEPRRFHAEVARNRRLTPMLTSLVVSNAIADAEPDVTDMVVTVTSKVGVKGYTPLELRDQIFSPEGVSGRALSMSRGLRAMGELLFNPFEPVVLDRIDVDVRVEYRRDVAEIIGVVAARPGSARGRHRTSAGHAAPVRRPRIRRDRAGGHPAHGGRRGDQDRGRVGRAGPPRRPAGGVAARLHRQHAQVLRRVHHRGDAADPRRGRVAARAADPGTARVGDGHAATLQADQARRLVRDRRSHGVPGAPARQRQARAAGARQVRRSRKVTCPSRPGRRNRPESLTIAAPACAPSRS